MSSGIGLLVLIVFALSVRLTGVGRACGRGLAVLAREFRAFRAHDLTERDRERIAQAASLLMLKLSASILVRSVVATFPAVALIWLFDRLHLAGASDVLERLRSWPLLIVAALALTPALLVRQ